MPPAGDADADAVHLLLALTSGEAKKAGVLVHRRRSQTCGGRTRVERSPAVVELAVHHQIASRHQARRLGPPATSLVRFLLLFK